MSFKSRQKKRQAKMAIRKTKRQHGDVMRTRYYRTIVKRPARCAACGKHLRVGDEMVYKHQGPVTLCIPHADSDPYVDYTTSIRRERDRARKRNRKTVTC
jgi:hypothetical protein